MPIDLIDLAGTPHEMGRAHGEMFREKIREFAGIRIANAMRSLQKKKLRAAREELLELAAEHLPFHRDYHPAGWEEFCGIAEGSGLSREELLIENGLTDFVDVARERFSSGRPPAPEAEGCTAFIARGGATPDGESWLGQTWDMHPEAEGFVVAFRRRPEGAPATLTVTTTGCLSLAGISESGLGCGNNNLSPTDARPGVHYLAMIHKALSSPGYEAAVEAVTGAPRASGHNYACAGPGGRGVFIETTAAEFEMLGDAEPVSVHTNHYVTPRLRALSAREKSRSSLDRDARMRELLGASVTTEKVAAAFSDTAPDSDTCICRNAGQDSRTCATVLGRPASGELWATRGALPDGEWTRFML